MRLLSKNISITPINNISLSPTSYHKANKSIKLLSKNFTGKIKNTCLVGGVSSYSSFDLS